MDKAPVREIGRGLVVLILFMKVEEVHINTETCPASVLWTRPARDGMISLERRWIFISLLMCLIREPFQQQEKRRGENKKSIKQRNRKIDITENEGRKRNWIEDNFLTFIQKRKSM